MPSEPDSFKLIKQQRINIRRKRNVFGRIVFNKYSLITILPSIIFCIPLLYYELKFRRVCSMFNQYQEKFNNKISVYKKRDIFK